MFVAQILLRRRREKLYVDFEEHVDEVEGDVEEEVDKFHPMNPA